MKLILLAGAALGALTFAAQAADYNPITAKPATAATGDLSIYGGFFHYKQTESSDDTKSGSVIGGLARANVWLAPNMSAQFDLFGESSAYSYGSGPTTVDLAAHLSWRNPGYLVGIFGSVGSDWGDRFGTVGVEGMTYMGPFQLYGQAGFTTELTTQTNYSSFFVHGEARYFFNPDFMIAGNLGFATLDSESLSDDGGTAIRWGIDLEKKFTPTFGGTVSYRGAHVTDPNYAATQHYFTVGLKVYLGGGTLQSQAQGGATLKNFSTYTGVNNIDVVY